MKTLNFLFRVNIISHSYRFAIEEFRPSEECFVTFESDHLIQPYTGEFTIFYTPNNSDSMFLYLLGDINS